MSLPEMNALYERLKQRGKPEEDNVRLYWMTRDSFGQALSMGSPPPEEPRAFYSV